MNEQGPNISTYAVEVTSSGTEDKILCVQVEWPPSMLPIRDIDCSRDREI